MTILNNLTEITKAGDPMLRIRLPKAIYQAITEAAKANKRRPQDEFIKRIFATFKADAKLQEAHSKLLPQLQEIYQIYTNN